MADLTLATSAREAIPDLRPIVRANLVTLALDLGTTTGWALHGIDGLITSGTASFRPGRFDGGGMRYLRFTNWLTEIDRLSGPVAAIWFEEVRRHAATDAAHVYGGLMATLTSWAELRGIPYEGVPVGTIKRHATGKGNANKDAMMAAARRAASRPPTTTRPTPSRSCSGRWRPGEVCNERHAVHAQGLRRAPPQPRRGQARRMEGTGPAGRRH
jgi:hypothetical protein